MISIPKDSPRALVCRMLWFNMKMTPLLEKHCGNKYLEGNIELCKLRDKQMWKKIYQQYKEYFDKLFPVELRITNQELKDQLTVIYNYGVYPRHLDRKLQQAIGIFGKKNYGVYGKIT